MAPSKHHGCHSVIFRKAVYDISNNREISGTDFTMGIWQVLTTPLRFNFRSNNNSTPSTSPSEPSSPDIESAPDPDALKPTAEPTAEETDQLPPLPFELDLDELEYIEYRRQILDWRDGFEQQILCAGSSATQHLSQHLKKKLDGLGVFEKFLAKPASEVLVADFFMLVRAPLAEHVRTAENKLNRIIERLPETRLGSFNTAVTMVVGERDPDLQVIHDVTFRPGNHKDIYEKLHQLIHGKHGIIGNYIHIAKTTSNSLLAALTKKP